MLTMQKYRLQGLEERIASPNLGYRFSKEF
jgi:hypothetical protein